MSCAKTAEPIEMSFWIWTLVGPRKHVLGGVYVGAAWRIPLNRPCAAAMPSVVKLLWPLVSIILAALWNGADHYIFILWFLLSSSFYLLLSSIFYLFSSPNLSGRRLDVYHSSTHGVALVRIYDAGLKRAASGLLKMQDAKKIASLAPPRKFVGLYLRS